MKQISTNLLAVLCVMLLLFTACKKNSDFTVEGVVSGADGQMMYLENVGVSTVELMDSVKLTAAGKFSFTKPRPAFPDFYRLRLNNQLINFSVDSTETISFVADAGTFATSYSVEGSENCKAIKNITLAQLDANQAIHRLRKESESGLLADSVYSRQVLEAAEAYKDVARKYIYSAPMSAAAYFALFQQIDGLLFFDLYDKNDSKAYGAVATSFDHYYPENTKLSSVATGKVVLINFTAYMSEWSPALNMEFGDLYTRYHDKGLEIYQISLDSDLHFWKNAASNLPWACVRDPQSVYSQTAALYNVKQLPAIFILDRKGNLVKRVDDVKKLEADIKSVL